LHEATNPSSALRRRLRRQRLACVCSAVSAEGLLWCPSSDASVRGAGRNTTNGCDSHPASQLRLHRYCLRRSGGLTYSGTRIGRDPHNRGKTTTTIPTQLIPLIITINDGTTTHTYDPTIADSCASGQTDVNIITNSPIFTNNAWTMNGVGIGTTQYIDAFQRAVFWSPVQGTPYHLILHRTTLSSVALSFSPAGSSGTNYPASEFRGCATGFVGVVNFTDMDNMIQALITGPLAPMVNAGTFPIFLTQVLADPGHSIFANCCILGYHGAFFDPGLQIYSPFAIDTANVFGAPDVQILSHEMGEAINDPNGVNPTPLWGGIGQQPGCQNNFEVGDPLTPGHGPSNTFVVGGYHLQELAFFSWFYGGVSLGSGGKFSDNGSFNGDAKVCPPGGTN